MFDRPVPMPAHPQVSLGCAFLGLNQLDAVAEGIDDVAVLPAFDEMRVRCDGDSQFFQTVHESVVVEASEGRVRLRGRTKIRVDAEVQENRTALQPNAAAR